MLDDLRRDLPAVLIAFLVSRLLLLSVVAVLESSIPVAYDRPEYTDRPILGGLTGEDAIYYLGIAEGGYHLEPVKDQYVDWVFFPLYPLVTKLVAIPLMGDIPLAGVLAANLAFLAALLLLAVLSRDHLDGDRTRRSVLLLALAPGAVAFGMAYSDSLMLALWLGAVLAGERRRWWLAGILYGLSVLTRPPGILLGLALLALLVQQGGRRPNRDWLALAFGPLAILGFMAYQGAVLGDPLAFIHGQALWNIPPIVAPTGTPTPGAAGPNAAGSILPLVVLLYTVLFGYLLLLPLLRRDRMPLHVALVAIVAFASVFLSGRIQSDARYLAVGWPFAWLLANRKGSFTGDLAVAISAGLFVLFAFLHVTQALAP